MNIKDIADRLDENGIPAAPGLAEKLHIYLELLREWNSRMDLTAVLEDEETVDRHFIDSLTVLKTGLIGDASSLIDVGTGAGYPAGRTAEAAGLHSGRLRSNRNRQYCNRSCPGGRRGTKERTQGAV